MISNMFAGTDLPDRDPALSEFLVDQPLGEVEVFLDASSDTIQDYGSALRGKKQLVHDLVSDDALEEVLCRVGGIDPGTDLNRTTRHDMGQHKRKLRKDLLAALPSARSYAQSYIWDDSEEGQGLIDQAVQGYRDMAVDPEVGHAGHYGAAAWLAVFEAEKAFANAEKNLLFAIHDFFEEAPDNIVLLLERIRTEQLDAHEYRPLFTALAKGFFDPNLSRALPEIIADELAESPEMYKPTFIKIMGTFFDSEDTEHKADSEAIVGTDNLQWIEFIAAQQGMSPAELTASLNDLPLADWPAPLRERFISHYKGEFLPGMVALYKELLQPYADKDTFVIKTSQAFQQIGNRNIEITNARSKAGKKGSKKGGRVTNPGPRSAAIAQQESPEKVSGPAIKRISEIARGERGHVVVASHDFTEQEPTDEDLLKIGEVQDYLRAREKSDPRIRTDLLEMIRSILREPRGNGSTKMHRMFIPFTREGMTTNIKLAIWHLNPNDRHMSIGDTGRQTRVHYAFFTDNDGEEHLVIHRIAHNSEGKLTTTNYK